MASSSLLNVFLLQQKDSLQRDTEEMKELALTSLQGSNEISDPLTYSCHLLLPCPSKPALHHE